MAAMAATSSPSSLQLRFALNCGNCRKPSPLLVRAQLWKQNRFARLVWNGSGAERRRDGVSWVRSDSSVDGFSGWSGKDGGEESIDSERKKWFGGNVIIIFYSTFVFMNWVLWNGVDLTFLK